MDYPLEAQVAGKWIAFATFSDIGTGVYAWDGQTVHKVVDELTPVPGGNPTIVPYPEGAMMDVDATGSVVIFGSGQAGLGIWRWRVGGSVELVVRNGDPSPTATGETVLGVDRPRVWGSTAYVLLERSGGAPYVSEIVGFPNDGPAFPATPQDLQVMTPAFDAAGRLLYRAFDTDLINGVWRADPGQMPELLLAGGDSLVGGLPGETWIGSISRLLRFGLDGVVLSAAGTLGTRGFFSVAEPGVAHVLIRHGDPEPRTGLPIYRLPVESASASEHRFAFVAMLADGSLHLSVREPDGTFLPILSPGDVLEGRVVTGVWLSTKAFASDERLVAMISREGDLAIWTIDLPSLGGPAPAAIPAASPAGVVLLGFLLGVGGWVSVSRRGRGAPAPPWPARSARSGQTRAPNRRE